MTNTLATRKQSQAIRDRMQAIRCKLPYDADSARAHLQELTDWKYHMRERPWPILAAVAIAGYWLVPSKREDRVIVHSGTNLSREAPAAKKGMLGGIAGALLTLMLKQGTSIATRHLSNSLFPRRHATAAGESFHTHSFSDNVTP